MAFSQECRSPGNCDHSSVLPPSTGHWAQPQLVLPRLKECSLNLCFPGSWECQQQLDSSSFWPEPLGELPGCELGAIGLPLWAFSALFPSHLPGWPIFWCFNVCILRHWATNPLLNYSCSNCWNFKERNKGIFHSMIPLIPPSQIFNYLRNPILLSTGLAPVCLPTNSAKAFLLLHILSSICCLLIY